jgi:hypothetical protein
MVSNTESLPHCTINVPSSYYGRTPGLRPLDCPLDFTPKEWVRSQLIFVPEYEEYSIETLADYDCFVQADNRQFRAFYNYWDMIDFYLQKFKLYDFHTEKVIDEPLDMPGSLGLLTEYIHCYDMRRNTSVKTRCDAIQIPPETTIADECHKDSKIEDSEVPVKDNDLSRLENTSLDQDAQSSTSFCEVYDANFSEDEDSVASSTKNDKENP